MSELSRLTFMSIFPDDIKLAPSILAADMGHLADQVAQVVAAGADRIHVDVMDGHFVPNISFGPAVVRWLKPVTSLPLEVHLMISEPDRYLGAFAEAGADTLIVHQEGAIHLNRTVQEIHRLGLRAGVAINPATPAASARGDPAGPGPGAGDDRQPGFRRPGVLGRHAAQDPPRPPDDRRGLHRLRAGGRRRNRAAHDPACRRGWRGVLVAGSAVFRAPGGPPAGIEPPQGTT